MFGFNRGREFGSMDHPAAQENKQEHQGEKKKGSFKREIALAMGALGVFGSAQPAEARSFDDVAQIIRESSQAADSWRRTTNEGNRDKYDALVREMQIKADILIQQMNVMRDALQNQSEERVRMYEIWMRDRENMRQFLVNLISTAKSNEGRIPIELMEMMVQKANELAVGAKLPETPTVTGITSDMGRPEVLNAAGTGPKSPKTPKVESEKAKMIKEALQKGKKEAK